MLIPTGWHDDGTTLTAPNGIPVVRGFRDHILQSANWDTGNMPQGPELPASPVQYHNAALGGGTVQVFRDTLLWWTSQKGVVEEPYLGLEIEACYKLIEQLRQQLPPPATGLADAVNTLKTCSSLIQAAVTRLSS